MNLAFVQGIGPLELGIVLVIVLIIFGPKRLPSLGRQLGSGMREFKDSISGKSHDDEDGDETARAAAALGHPREDADDKDADRPVEGEVVSERR